MAQPRTCSTCRALFTPKHPNSRFCRTQCREVKIGRERRAKRGTTTSRGYDSTYRRNRPLALERDGWTCQMPRCRQATREIWQQAPRMHPLGGSADHIRPLSVGGTSDLDNLRAAHLGCNASAGAAHGNARRGQPGVVSYRPRIV